MKIYFLIAVIIVVSIKECEAQKQDSIYSKNLFNENKIEEPVLFETDELPEFPGGKSALQNYIETHLVYPEKARENGITGTVPIRFIIDKEGKVKKVTLRRTIEPSLDSAAIKVIKSLPDFTIPRQNGKPVNVWFITDVVFKLD